MNDDPEDERAKARSAQGLTRELQVIRKELPDPARGGCRGYPVWLRRDMLEKAANGEQVKAHHASLRRWEAEGVHAKRMTGNKQKDTVTGFDQFLLSFYTLVYPDFELNEAAAFIYNNGGGIYSRQDLSKRLKEMDVTRKKASTEAYQAFLPHNVLRT
jgi:GH24 family phage-related lysozyme (muramidase)